MQLSQIYDRGKATYQQLLAGGTLRAKALRGGVLLGGGSVAEQASRFARNMILTRLLAPSAFGAMAIVMSSSAIVGTLTEVGLRAAVIQNPRGGEKAYLNAGWWMAMWRALVIYVTLFALSPWIARFYGNAELGGLLRVAMLSTLFDGAMSPGSILPQKQMKFERWMAITNGGAICGVVLTLVLSFVLRDVWALAIGTCSENGFRCIFSYILCPGLPSFGWDRAVVRDLYKFSRGVFGLSFLNLIFSRTDIFVLGKLYSATTLGLYSMAVYLVQTPSIFLTTLLVQTLFPSFAHVQEDKERVNRIVVEVTSWGILLGLPGVVVIAFCGSSLLTVIYGARYVPAAGPLAVAAGVVFLNVLNAVITIVFNGMGVPQLHRRAVTASAIVMLVAVYPACKVLGVVGGQAAALLAVIVSYIFQILRLRSLTGLNLARYTKPFIPATLVSGGIVAVGLSARFLGFQMQPLANIATGVAACIVAYALCVPAFLKSRQIA
jgi:O-antigen/teichoic acid export membrane protein